jgi:hypothetical protein
MAARTTHAVEPICSAAADRTVDVLSQSSPENRSTCLFGGSTGRDLTEETVGDIWLGEVGVLPRWTGATDGRCLKRVATYADGGMKLTDHAPAD